MKKPDATTVIARANFKQIIWPLPVSDLLFVGKKTKETLERLNIRTIGQLAQSDPALLERHLKKPGRVLWENANGLDTEPVSAWTDRPKVDSVGNGLTFRRNLVGLDDIRTAIYDLSDEVAYRMRRHGMKCRTVSVQIRDPNFNTISRQTTLDTPTHLASEISETAIHLIEANWNLNAPIRMLTVTGMNLVDAHEAYEQLDLFASDTAAKRERRERLEGAVAQLRDKYGREIISTAGVLGSDLGLREDAPLEEKPDADGEP